MGLTGQPKEMGLGSALPRVRSPLRFQVSGFILLFALCATADPVLTYMETWDSGTQGWGLGPGFAELDNPGSGGSGGEGGFLRLKFGELGEQPIGGEDYDYMKSVADPATNFFLGDYREIVGFKFNFLADTTLPSDLEMRFGSDASGSTRIWSSELNISSLTIGDWTTLYAPLGFGNFLGAPGTGAADFLEDIESVTWIGIYVRRDGLDEQIYGLDNFMLYIPEPGEVTLLLTALLGLAGSFRKKLGQACAFLRG